MTDPESDLKGRWIHSHEEDGPAHRVFRRPDFPFPPSRGRTELDVGPDMAVRQSGPGADDRRAAYVDARIGLDPASAGADDYLHVTSVQPDRLVIAKE